MTFRNHTTDDRAVHDSRGGFGANADRRGEQEADRRRSETQRHSGHGLHGWFALHRDGATKIRAFPVA